MNTPSLNKGPAPRIRRLRKLALPLATGVLASISLGGFVRGASDARPNPLPTFQQYCFQCHANGKAMGGVHLDELTSKSSVGEGFQTWQRVAAALEENKMPPKGLPQPSEEQRAHAVAWIKAELDAFAHKNAGDPGRVTVRRLTSGEYGYAIHDLTGLDLDVGRDFANDSVGGEGFMNFGDVQFVQDANLERYLETAKLVADHAVIGAGPIEFFGHPGKTGFELSAITRIKDIYAKYGFRTVSGEGGDSFGLEKYRKVFYAAWRYQHRSGNITLREIAAQEGVSPRFTRHILSVVNRPSLGYPASEAAARWHKLPADEAGARAGCEDLEKFVTTWPLWLFARGDKAVGGAGDESPLLFTDAALKAELSHHFTYNIGGRGARVTKGPHNVYLNVVSVDPHQTAPPVVIWRNPTILVRRTPPTKPVALGEAEAEQAGGVVKPKKPEAGPRIPLKDFIAEPTAAKLAFGKGPDGASIPASDFTTEGSAFFEVPMPEGAFGLEFQVDAAIGGKRDQIIRVTFSDRADGPVRGIPIHAILGNPEGTAYRAFKAGVLEFVSLLPPNSNSEPTPADKDPPPDPFDPTYNTPEHDAFDTQVKYHRDDRFVVEKMLDDVTRVRLDRAWTDLYSSFEYYDAYLRLLAEHYKVDLKGVTMAKLDKAQIDAMPAEAQKHVRPLRAEYLETMAAEAAAHPGHVEDCLRFASRAWRRPLTPAEKESLRAFYRKMMESEQDHTKAVRALLTRILVSPAFLYRAEQATDIAPAKPLSEWEVASRMSFFLWSSVPDDELRRAAAAGELSNPQQLQRQVKRMLADPKARRLSAEFFGQWLGFYRFDQYKGVDTGRFPEFTDEVKTAMYDEAVSFFEYIVRNDRPVRDLLYADYTFLNKTLAKYYGIKKEIKSAAEAEKVDGANAFERGGMLRLGAVLTATSAPLRTSPVKRGDWVLRRILGTPTPPPPADAGSIPADDKLFGGLSLHEKLEAHKRNATCASCHTRIDPLGFPLEHYDSTGRWRDKYADGKPVYDQGTTADKFEISGAKGLLDYLQTKDERVRRTLAYKLLGYALGRTILPSDLPLIEQMVAAGPDAPFSQLITRIVASRQFRNHAGREEEPAKLATAKTNTSDKVGAR